LRELTTEFDQAVGITSNQIDYPTQKSIPPLDRVNINNTYKNSNFLYFKILQFQHNRSVPIKIKPVVIDNTTALL